MKTLELHYPMIQFLIKNNIIDNQLGTEHIGITEKVIVEVLCTVKASQRWGLKLWSNVTFHLRAKPMVNLTW